MGWMRDRRVLAALATGYAVALVVLVGGPWGWALNRLTVACYVQLRHDWPIAPDTPTIVDGAHAASSRNAPTRAGSATTAAVR